MTSSGGGGGRECRVEEERSERCPRDCGGKLMTAVHCRPGQVTKIKQIKINHMPIFQSIYFTL